MRFERWMGAAVTVLIASILFAGVAAAQVGQAELAQQIAQGGAYERFAAARHVLEMGPENAGPVLREAAVLAFSEVASAHRAYRRGEAPQPDLDVLGTLALVVGEYRDPRTLQPLTDALGTGSAVPRGLAAFGDPAVPYLTEAVRTGESTAVVTDALLGLRFLAEGVGRIPLTASSREELIAVARERMEPKQSVHSILRRAIDLAVVLDDPEIRKTVEAMAADPAEVQSRLEDWSSRAVERTVEEARERLRGVPPLPRWEAIGGIGR